MFNEHREMMHEVYTHARNYFIQNPQELIALEEYLANKTVNIIRQNLEEFVSDYNEASFLNPFWASYPPEDRGRKPRGDQVPWIEVGEHSIGHKLTRLMNSEYTIREIGLPSGSDDRFLLKSNDFESLNKLTNSVMLFSDVKSVGPRDDAEHIVLSPYQISGDGIWNTPSENMYNNKMQAIGKKSAHEVWPAIPPLYILQNGTIAPVIHIYLKPVYNMLSLESSKHGQPLKKIRVITVPNGLLLTQNPNYLSTYPSLFYPGKDDKSKAPRKVRCRVSFDLLRSLHTWRVQDIEVEI
ncbi:BglI family type II restriction endonuclease [Priestia aryabhattai]|uniref:BglI family type II restriction endonuclease n=1 Tax=Priestia aryabhattai TaxID=412384 RepID=UPI0039830E2C